MANIVVGGGVTGNEFYRPNPETFNNDRALWVQRFSDRITGNTGEIIGGYIQFTNGFLICWGIAWSNGNFAFTFPIPFANTGYSVMCTDIYDSSTNKGYAYATNKTTTGFMSVSGDSSRAQYIAIGRWKDIS